jgi:membrane-associated phospholipid phosphatase
VQSASSLSVRHYRRFMAAMLLWWLASAAYLLAWPKAAGYLQLRAAVGQPWADGLFTWLTHAGDGLLAIALVLLFFFTQKKPLAFVLLAAYAGSGLVAQLLKELVAAPRPLAYFEGLGQQLQAVEGVELLRSANSFPSGHTATAFAVATALVLLHPWWNRRWWLAALLAVLVGFSRIHLGQHFLADVWVGSMLGVGAAWAGLAWYRRWQPRWAA